MTPNLFVLGKTVFSPHKWFDEKKKPSSNSADAESGIQHWEHPVPGYYEHEPGRGWYLIAKDGATQGSIKVPRTKVTYSKILKRWIFQSDMDDRKRRGRFLDENVSQAEVGFFRLDDGAAWVNSSDAKGDFLAGPYTLYCIDAQTNRFRVMKKRDDPIRQQRKQLQSYSSSVGRSRQSSTASSASDDAISKYRKESNVLRPNGPPSSRTYTSSRTPSVEPRQQSETLPMSTCRVHSISG